MMMALAGYHRMLEDTTLSSDMFVRKEITQSISFCRVRLARRAKLRDAKVLRVIRLVNCVGSKNIKNKCRHKDRH
ncbi:hypothetical protein PAXRUDRAFT_471625 [Paxillus rubicundulus Ve08.2h10]|uniref:Uncharacterized protein n=1 Tax=Paxillus rubicundulus Ve08.2h10 TaxID=930991 RepID=A0A0D0DWC4_9AGAM|nr:hypothetical protein PAXRUDRAFT_471625 [Paxillus rubicundulus Ve08.2h10]